MFQRRTARRFVPGREPGAAPTITAVRNEAECVPQSPLAAIGGSTSFCLRWLPNRCAGKRHGNTGRCPASTPAAMRHCRIDPDTRHVILYTHQIGICRRYRRRCPRNRRGPSSARASGCKELARSTAAMGHGDHGLEVVGSGPLAQDDARGGVSTPHRYSTCRSWCCTGMEKKSNCLPDCRRSYQQTSLGNSAWVPLGTAHSVCGVVAMSSLAVAIRCLAEGGILAHNHLATSCTSFA